MLLPLSHAVKTRGIDAMNVASLNTVIAGCVSCHEDIRSMKPMKRALRCSSDNRWLQFPSEIFSLRFCTVIVRPLSPTTRFDHENAFLPFQRTNSNECARWRVGSFFRRRCHGHCMNVKTVNAVGALEGTRSRGGGDGFDTTCLSIMQATLESIRSAGVIACLRSESADLALGAGRAALDGGVSVLEVTMTTPGAVKVIQRLMLEYPSANIGAGTVLTREEAEKAKEAGAKFLMSPVAIQEIVLAHNNGPVLFIPGAMTPTEVLTAFNWGASTVKIYPMSLIGGVQYVRTLRKPFSHIPLIASNGVGLDMVESYIHAGAMAVVLSDAIFSRSAMDTHDFNQIKRQAQVAALKGSAAATQESHPSQRKPLKGVLNDFEI